MLKYKAIFIFSLVFFLNFMASRLVFSEESRNPFKDWFPVKVVEQPRADAVAPISIEQEPLFNTSLYKVEGLIWGTDSPKAIINKKIYGLGDTLDQAEIISIGKEGVGLTFAGKEYAITTKPAIKIKEKEEDNEDKAKETEVSGGEQ